MRLLLNYIKQQNTPKTISSTKAQLVTYNEPTNKDMAIVLVYFNPCKYNRIAQNALTIKHLFDSANIPYFIGELKHTKDKYLFKSDSNIFQYNSDSYMFYKENLITTIEKLIPPKFTKLCIIDFDIFFDNADWYSIASEKLNTVSVTQPFVRTSWLNLDYTIATVKTNCVDNPKKTVIDYSREHTGFVWAFDRQWFAQYKMCDNTINCLGDTIFANNITKRPYNDIGSLLYYKISNDTKYDKDVTYGSCNLNIYHLNHGPMVNRQYTSIHVMLFELFKKLKVDNVDTVLMRRDDNILEWRPEYIDTFNEFMMDYFVKRNDDMI